MSKLESEHLHAAYTIWLTTGWNDVYALGEGDFLRSWLASPVKVGAWVDGRLVGIGRANTDLIMYAMIHDVVVEPQFRGKGHGRAIVTELINALSAMKVRSIQLMSAAGQAPFYERLGFKARASDRPGMNYEWPAAQQGNSGGRLRRC